MTDHPEATPLSTAARTDPRVREIVADIEAGRAQFCAPCDAMHIEPTDDDEAELDRVLDKIFSN